MQKLVAAGIRPPVAPPKPALARNAPAALKVLAALTLLASLAGCASPSPGPASTSPAPPPPSWVDHLDVQGFAFVPNPAKVPAARPVVLHNHDTAPHQIVAHAPNGAQVFDAPLEPGASVSVTFPDAQSYHVFCNIHTTMPSVTVTAVAVTSVAVTSVAA